MILIIRANIEWIVDLPKSEAGTIFETMVLHMGPPMERKMPRAIDRYMCQGSMAKPLVRLLSISEPSESSARVTTDRPKTLRSSNTYIYTADTLSNSCTYLAQHQESNQSAQHGHNLADGLKECELAHRPVKLLAHKQVHDGHGTI